MSAPMPALRTSGIVLYSGDALEVLRQLSAASVDACITDPPYGEDNAPWDTPRSREWYRAWLAEVVRVVVPNGPIVTFAPRRKLDLVMSALREVRGDASACPIQRLVWVHRQGFRVAAGYLRPEHEEIVASGLLAAESEEVRRFRPNAPTARPDYRIVRTASGFGPDAHVPHPARRMAGSVIELPRRKRASERTGHPTQKPERLMRYLVALAVPPGGAVLDPFAGSGTTLVAARDMGRRAIGIERAPATCRIVDRRTIQETLAFEPGEPLPGLDCPPSRERDGRETATVGSDA